MPRCCTCRQIRVNQDFDQVARGLGVYSSAWAVTQVLRYACASARTVVRVETRCVRPLSRVALAFAPFDVVFPSCSFSKASVRPPDDLSSIHSRKSPKSIITGRPGMYLSST